jgi:hypothetical protein
MDRHVALVCVLTLSSCALFEEIKDAVDGVVNRNVVVGVVSTVDASLDGDPMLTEQIDLEALGFEGGVVGTMFLADAASVADLDNAPVSGADVVLEGCGVEVAMPELDSQDGAYVYVPPGELDACDGPTFTMRRLDGADEISATTTIPDPLNLAVPFAWTSGDAMTLSLTAAGVNSAVVVVVDATSGEVTYSNEPETVAEYYEFLRGTDFIDEVVIPGSAFRPDAVHAVSVTGLVRTPNRELVNANELLSVVAGGRTELYPVSTVVLDIDTDAFDTDMLP